jgi:hypothetical protein
MLNTITRAENFILKQARPLDYEIFKLQYGKSNRKWCWMHLPLMKTRMAITAVLLSRIIFSSFSLPIPSWTAVSYLRRISCYDLTLPLVKKIRSLTCMHPGGRMAIGTPPTHARRIFRTRLGGRIKSLSTGFGNLSQPRKFPAIY